MFTTQRLELDDFTGGITDDFIGREPSRYQRAKNFLVTVDKSLLVRPGSVAEGITNATAMLPGNAPVDFLLSPLVQTERPYKLSTAGGEGRFYHFLGGTHVELTGPTGNSLFTASHASATDHRFSATRWNGHYFITSASFTEKVQKVFIDTSDVLQLRTAGLPAPAGGSVTYSGAAGANSYLYLLGYKYTYTVGDRTYIDRGPVYNLPTYTGTQPNTLGSLPVLANGASDNYDTATLVLEIYRTVNNGDVYYFVGQVTNGTTSFLDAVSDATLQNNATHYTTGGVQEFDPPPTCKFVHVTERGIGFYGYCNDGLDTIQNRVRQSIPGDPDSCPASFFDDADDEITGISSFRGIPIVFGRNNIYRGDGIFDRFGNGGLVLRKITDTIGCLSHNSIVQSYQGVFFAGEHGFYWTDGYTVQKISDEINDSYANFYPTDTRRNAIVGAFDEINQRVWWTLTEATNSDGFFVFHLRYGVKPGGVFTTVGAFTSTSYDESNIIPSAVPTTINQNYRAKCVLYFNGTLYRGDDRGYAFMFSPTAKTDPRVETGADVGTWGTSAIYYEFRTVAMNFGTDYVRKWTPKVITTLVNQGDISLQIRSDRDVNITPQRCKEIKERGTFSWGDPGVLWGDEVIYSSDQALIISSRMLPVPGIRCSYRSLWLSNAFTIIQKSDNLGNATVNFALKTATLVNAATEDWPLDIKDYYISFSDDNYTDKFLITTFSADTVTFSDSSGQAPASGTYSWQIHGFAKEEIIEIQSLVVPYALITDTQEAYRPGTEGGNA